MVVLLVPKGHTDERDYSDAVHLSRPVVRRNALYGTPRKTDRQRRYDHSTLYPVEHPCNPRWPIEVAAAAEKALKEYKVLHPDVQDEDIRVELPPRPDNLNPALLARPPHLPPPPAYVQVHHANRAHVPIAHPVMALPFPHGFPVFDFDRIFAQGPQVYGELGPRPAPNNGARARYPIPPGGAFNPLLPPFNMPPPPPPLQQALPPLHMALGHALRMAGRRHRR